MSLIIEGIEMPKPGAYMCELGVLDDNTAVLTIYTPINEPQKSYTLIPVPPHGDLIDRDQMVEKAKEDWVYDLSDLPEFASYLPVVIAKEETNNDI